MKIYFAGISGNKKRLEYLKRFGAKRLMLTFADKKYYGKQMYRFKNMEFEILCDSGAFSVWKKNSKINIDEYCDFIKKNDISKYINLDDIENDDATDKNQKYMESKKLNPIPVFHYQSNFDNLKRIIDNGYKYICLGGSVGQTRNNKIKFFNNIFSKYDNINFHGLGISDIEIVNNFPFFSVDSTTWLIAEKIGKIFDENGKRITPPLGMTSEEKFKNTIEYFVKMENLC